METEISSTPISDAWRRPGSARDDDVGVIVQPFVVLERTSMLAQLLARGVVAFAVTIAFAVLVMITVIVLFQGAGDTTTTTTQVDPTPPRDPAQTCYPFGGCTPFEPAG